MKLSPAEKTGFICLLLFLCLLPFSPYLALLPPVVFLCLCLIAPFFPSTCFFLPAISKVRGGKGKVSITFDDGPHPDSTPYILYLLDKHNIKATFFVIGRQAEKYPDLMEKIEEAGHALANHSFTHDYFLMFRSLERLHADIYKTQNIIGQYSNCLPFFRPPMAIVNSRLPVVLAKENLHLINFSCRAFDFGNRRVKGMASKILAKAADGDIIMLHDNPPRTSAAQELWQDELNRLLSCLTKRYRIVPVSDLLSLK